MARIFVSYSRADRQFLDEFVPLLQKVYGLDAVWYDEQIHGGADWWELILNQVDSCDLFVYLASNDSLSSPYCQAEFREALRLHKQILPVVVRPKTQYPGDVPEDIREVLSRTQFVDMSRGFRDAGVIAQIYAAVNRLLDLAPQTTGAPLTATPIGQPPVPDRKRRWKLTPIWAVFIAAVIVGAFGIAAVLISNIGGEPSSTDTPHPLTEIAISNAQSSAIAQTTIEAGWTDTPIPPTADATQTYNAFETVVASTQLASMPTSNPTATATSTAANTATSTPTRFSLQLAQTPVLRNSEWTPVVEEFDGVEMVLVPSGCFTMGSDDGDSDEQPEHQVCLEDPYWIDRTEVTNEQFAQFEGVAESSSYFSGANLPREQITWTEAQAFCESRQARLPTEAEWEYAARGPDGLDYPWGNDFSCRLGNFDDENQRDFLVVSGGLGCDGFDDTAPAGSFPEGASWVGALDMVGNVWEWVADRAGPYHAWRQVDPTGPIEGTQRVLRGGSGDNSDGSTLTAYVRMASDPDSAYNFRGFRCARSAFD